MLLLLFCSTFVLLAHSSDSVPAGCNVADPSSLGNGYCDQLLGLNVEECNWDAGDCCQSTCVSSTFFCSEEGFKYCHNGIERLDSNSFVGGQAITNTPVGAPTPSPTRLVEFMTTISVSKTVSGVGSTDWTDGCTAAFMSAIWSTFSPYLTVSSIDVSSPRVDTVTLGMTGALPAAQQTCSTSSKVPINYNFVVSYDSEDMLSGIQDTVQSLVQSDFQSNLRLDAVKIGSSASCLTAAKVSLISVSNTGSGVKHNSFTPTLAPISAPSAEPIISPTGMPTMNNSILFDYGSGGEECIPCLAYEDNDAGHKIQDPVLGNPEDGVAPGISGAEGNLDKDQDKNDQNNDQRINQNNPNNNQQNNQKNNQEKNNQVNQGNQANQANQNKNNQGNQANQANQNKNNQVNQGNQANQGKNNKKRNLQSESGGSDYSEEQLLRPRHRGDLEARLYGHDNSWWRKDGHGTSYVVTDSSAEKVYYIGTLCPGKRCDSSCEMKLNAGEYVFRVGGFSDPNRDEISWNFCSSHGGARTALSFKVDEYGHCIPQRWSMKADVESESDDTNSEDSLSSETETTLQFRGILEVTNILTTEFVDGDIMIMESAVASLLALVPALKVVTDDVVSIQSITSGVTQSEEGVGQQALSGLVAFSLSLKADEFGVDGTNDGEINILALTIFEGMESACSSGKLVDYVTTLAGSYGMSNMADVTSVRVVELQLSNVIHESASNSGDTNGQSESDGDKKSILGSILINLLLVACLVAGVWYVYDSTIASKTRKPDEDKVGSEISNSHPSIEQIYGKPESYEEWQYQQQKSMPDSVPLQAIHNSMTTKNDADEITFTPNVPAINFEPPSHWTNKLLKPVVHSIPTIPTASPKIGPVTPAITTPSNVDVTDPNFSSARFLV